MKAKFNSFHCKIFEEANIQTKARNRRRELSYRSLLRYLYTKTSELFDCSLAI